MSGRTGIRTCVGALLVLATGCHGLALNSSGIPNYQQDRLELALQQVAFRYPECARAEIRQVRVSPNGRLVELSICGTSRWYQDVSEDGGVPAACPNHCPTWIDVTSATTL